MPGPVHLSLFKGELVRRMFGPLADEIGADLAERYRDWRLGNLGPVVDKMSEKLDESADADAFVSPRVAMQVLEAASWCDGEVMSEYFGGILASAVTPGGADDRGTTWAGVVSRLATADVHLHYLAYDAFRRAFLDSDLNLQMSSDAAKMQIYLPACPLLVAMGAECSAENFGRIVIPALSSLVREGLLADRYWFGDPATLAKAAGIDDLFDSGIVVQPSIQGAQLFLWAHGQGSEPAGALIVSRLELASIDDLGVVERSQSLDDIRDRGPLPPPTGTGAG